MCSKFSGVRETNTRIPHQHRNKTLFFGRGFENEMFASSAIVGLCFGGKPKRPSGKRHSLSPSVDHMSLDVVDHIPGNSRKFIPSQTLHFRGTRGGHPHDHERSQSEIETHLSDILTEGAFATTQWKFLMRLFDNYPPSFLKCGPQILRIITFSRC